MTLSPRIEALQAKRAADIAIMSKMLEDAGAEDRDLTEEETKTYDEKKAGIAKMDADLSRLVELEKLSSSKAIVISHPAAPASPPAPVATVEPQVRKTVFSKELPKGIMAARLAMSLVMSKKLGWDIDTYVKQNFSDTPEISLMAKAAVLPIGTGPDPMATGTPYLGDGSALLREAWLDFIGFLRPQTILGQLRGIRNVSFGSNYKLNMGKMTSGAIASYVGESKSKRVQSLSFGEISLIPYKAACIVVFTDELMKWSNPSIEALVRDDLASALAEVVDLQFINGVGTVGVSPPGIMTFAPAANKANSASSDATPTIPEVTTDLKFCIMALRTKNVRMQSPVWLMNPRTWESVRLQQNDQGYFPWKVELEANRLLGIPVVTSLNVPANLGAGTNEGVIILLDASEVVFADDGGIEFSMSNEASLQMDSAPATPPTPLVSLWQQDMTGIRAVWHHSWTMRRDFAIAYVAKVLY